jgi:ribosomal protein S18 acetylase RimI-like enzyme
MSEYIIRKASEKDIPFLAEIVIAAEKGNSDKLSYSTLFNISEEKAKELIIAMFEEEIEGCEFSVDSFLIAEIDTEAVAGFGAWIEGFDGNSPSKILKSNLISYTFGPDCIAYLKTKANLLKDFLTEREPLALQFEYLFVSNKHRGNHLATLLIEKHIEQAKQLYPELQKAQVQLFKNNANAVSVYERNGFETVQTLRSNEPELLNYLPYNEKLLMEKKI